MLLGHLAVAADLALSPLCLADVMCLDMVHAIGVAKLRKTTPVFLVGDIGATMSWYEAIGFEAQYFPPGFCILRRDAIQIFLQVHEGYVRPDDPGARERDAWNAYIETDDATALFEEISKLPDMRVLRPPRRQPYGNIEFEIADPNGYVLVFAQQME